MNFFAQQERARAHTKRMLILFVLAVACIVGALDLVLFLAFGSSGHGVHPGFGAVMLWNSVLVVGIIGACSLYKIAALRGGGGVVARQLGATLVEPGTTDFAHQRLRNVVEEVAIASGVPVPEVYVLEGEPAINAFAAGYTPADAAVTVTQGCLDKLNREELQGVIAHEFSHVLNGDMRLNIRLMGVLFGILVIGIIGRKIASNTGRSRDSGYAVLIGVAILAIGYIGVFFGRLIKAGISRQREYLADASAVQFTRQTRGISGALKKIGSLPDGSTLASGETEEVAHMLFGDGVGYSTLFATHPPLHLRIKAIDPAFDPAELDAIAKAWANPVPVGDSGGAQVSISGFAPAAIATAMGASVPAVAPAKSSVLPQADAQISLTPKEVVTQVAKPGNDDYRTAGAIHTTISDKLRALAYMGARCMQVVFALALDTDAAMRGKQLALLEKRFGGDTRKGVEEIVAETDGLHPMQRLPLAQIAFPALRRQPRPQLQTFLIGLNDLIQADGEVRLEEYCLAKLVGVQVMDALDPSKARPTGSTKLSSCASEVADAVAIVAEYGADNEADAERAYLVGMNEALPGDIAPYTQRAEWMVALDRALPILDALTPAGKELLVRGLTAAIGADGKVSVIEAELLRTMCAALHCPLPPQLDQAA